MGVSSKRQAAVNVGKAIVCALVGAAIYASLVQPHPPTRAEGPPILAHETVLEAGRTVETGFDPFTEGPVPLKIILVASQGKGNPLFGLPRIWMSVHHNEYISNEMERGLYGPSWWFKMVGAVQKEKLLVDIGFNIGGVGIVAAAQGMRVIGFEPVRKNWILGQQSIRLNHLQSRVTLHHAAVHWSGEKMRIFHNFSTEADGRNNAGQGTLGHVSDSVAKQAIETHMYEDIDTMALSEAVHDEVWLMKLDVEGCECHCLRSGDALFARERRPPAVAVRPSITSTSSQSTALVSARRLRGVVQTARAQSSTTR
eukprot:m.429296 g.429296  ORF g.429296 m.429296 type:complete len:312 (+) comp21386_c1_seq3:123-1058(+)